MPCRISSRVGSGFASTSAAAETIWPGVQKPHCSASARTNAATSGWSRRPSIVVTSRPSTVCTSVMHESTGTPSSCTVHAPQWPSPHAIFVPVRPRSSRSTSASVRPTAGSTSYAWPLTLSMRGHRQDVREVEHPEGGPRRPARARPRPRPPGRPRHSSRAVSISSRICSVASRWPFERSSQAFRASPSTPIVSAWRVQSSGVAIERYAWMRANVSGCEIVSGPRGGASGSGASPRQIRARRAAEHRAHLILVEARPPAPCAARGAATRAAGRTGSRRRRAPAPARRAGRGRGCRAGSRRTCRRRRPRWPEKQSASAARSAIPQWAMISCTPSKRSTRCRRPSAIGGRPRPPWIRIGTRRSQASSKTGASRSSFSRNFCARGCSLIPRAPASRQRRASSIGPFCEVEPDERHEPALGARRVVERAVVRGAEAGMPVGLVEAEHERARDAVALLPLEELVEVADHSVHVGPQMDVRVEDLDVRAAARRGRPHGSSR